jgi:hypothetical protein
MIKKGQKSHSFSRWPKNTDFSVSGCSDVLDYWYPNPEFGQKGEIQKCVFLIIFFGVKFGVCQKHPWSIKEKCVMDFDHFLMILGRFWDHICSIMG